ncbi:MAG: RNA methyltransferase [Weeksellaceae bacterium]
MQIDSLQNPRIKNLLKLQQKSRERRKQNLFVVEGIQENKLALQSCFQVVEFYVAEELFQASFQLSSDLIFKVSPSLYEKIAYRGTTGGIIGIYQSKSTELNQIHIQGNGLIVILESVEKPGNLGAVLRSCDGAGADLLIVCDPLTDFYNPNVIRSSVGTVFTNPLVSAPKEEVVKWLKQNKIQIVSTFLRENTKSLYEVDLRKSSAIVFGTEASGLTDFWEENSDVLIKIPMKGKVDSLNVSNAAAICIYEAVRQKMEVRK